jgi:hypothetical protein
LSKPIVPTIHITVTIPKITPGNSERKQFSHIMSPSLLVGDFTKPRIAEICFWVSIEVILFASSWNNVFTLKALKSPERPVQIERTERTISEKPERKTELAAGEFVHFG